ncbi:MAG TPA: DNA polymerase III subunit beta [Burkholderiales bacterium]|nr:DNA polymerase III subunit beta [Burkholderiales bacterium]
MKLLQIERDALLTPLQAVTGIVEKRHTLPILSNVLIERKKEKLNLIATDLEIQITTSCEAGGKVSEDQSLTVSARKLQDILRSLPDGAETTLDLQANKVQVKAGKSRFNLQTMPADDFPKMADAGELQAKFSISQKVLQDLLLLVQYAMAQQDIRYYLNGLLLVLDGAKIKVVATDGHRLSYAEGPLASPHDKREVILPRKAVLELSRQLSSGDADVKVEIYASQVRFHYGNSELITKIIDGKFPDFTRVIPVNYNKTITLSRQELLQSLQRAAILSNEKFRGVRWMLTGSSLRISCTNTEQEEAQEEMEVVYNGEALDVGFNITYLLDVLNNVHTDNVECSFGDANSSMLITVPGRDDFRYVVMPMRI